MSGFCWSFILDISDDLLRAIRKIVSVMINMIVNRMLTNVYQGLAIFHA